MNENKNTQITLTKSSSVSEILLENDNNAKEIFKNLKQNLYNVEHWNMVKDREYCHFQLCNKHGEEKTGFDKKDYDKAVKWTSEQIDL